MTNKKYLDLDSLKEYHLKLKPVIESKANSSEVYNKNDVYTKDQVDSALDSKSDVGHTHNQYVTEQNVYTKEQVDLALESKSDISHTHDQYLTDIGIDILFDGSDTLKGTATDYKILGVDSTKTYYLSGTKFIGIGCTNITITPIVATSATCTYDEETGVVSWTIYGASSSGPVSANLSWTGAPGILTSTKDGIKTTVGYFNTINGESVVSKTGAKDFDIYTKNQIDDALSAKADASNVYNKSEINTKLNDKANVSDVYTTTQVDTKLSSKADISNVYNKSEINTKLNAKANSSDVYTTSQVDTKLSEKANSSDVYTTTQVDTKLSSKADTSNVYNKSEINTKLNAKANSSDVYTTEQVDTKLNAKANVSDVYNKSDVDTKLSEKSDISHDHDSDYLTDVSIDPTSLNKFKIVTGTTGTQQIEPDPNGPAYYMASGTINIGTNATNVSMESIAVYKSYSYNKSTGDVSWTLGSIKKSSSVSGTITWAISVDELTSTKDGTNTTVGYFNTINGESVVSKTGANTKNFDLYSKSEVDTKLSLKADISNVYNKSEINTKLNAKADASNVYSKSDVDTKLSEKANISDVYTASEVDLKINGINLKLNSKADKDTTLSGYGITDAYTKTETDTKLNGKADKATTLSEYGITDAYTKSDVNTKLSEKANLNGGNTFSGLQSINAPTNISGSEQTNMKIKTSNGGSIAFGKEGQNSGTMIRLDQTDGTCRLRFRASSSAGAMVWEQPEQGAQLYIDLGKNGADKHRIQFPSSAGTLALKSQIPTVNNGTLTIQKNGTNVQTFTANQSGNVTANISVPTKTSQLTNDSGYINDVEITSSSSGSTLVKGTTGSNAVDLGNGPRYPATGTINIGLGATDITITPLAAIDANGSYNPSTGDYSWTLYAATEKAKVTGTIKWSGGDDQLKITKNGSENVVGYFNKINGQSIVALTAPKDFSFYTKTETDNKYAPKSHSHESIIDYGDISNTIKIGYRGNGLTASQIAYIAGYSVDDPQKPNEHKIKDISKDVLKSWLGSEVVTGSLSTGNSLTIASSTYVWIVYPQTYSTNTFSFSIGSSNYTGYHFAIIQSGTPGCIRYFSSTTTLKSATTTSITFSTAVNYVRFKIG